MRAYEFLTEYRRAGDKFPKQAAIDVLKKYKDQDDVYISFTSIDKLGVNPQSEHCTPNGIYCYPLKAAWDYYKIGEYGINSFPYASRQPYIWIFKGNIPDITEITNADFRQARKKLKQIGDKWLFDYHDPGFLKSYINKYPGKMLWELTNGLTKSPNKWAHLFLKLGYNGISDKTGTRVIFPTEPVQAVFFTKKAITILERIHNITPKDKTHGNKIASIKKEIKASSYDQLKSKLEIYPHYIQYIKNPPEELQYIAVNSRATSIQYIQNPSEELQYIAVNNDAYSVNYIKRPSEKTQLIAVSKDWKSLLDIISNGNIPSEQVIKTAINNPHTSNGPRKTYMKQYYIEQELKKIGIDPAKYYEKVVT